MYLNGLVDIVKEGVQSSDLVGLIFYIIGVFDGISMGIIGMCYSLFSCDIIVDSIEMVVGVQWYDGLVIVVGCDKNMLGVMIVLVCFNCFVILVYGGMISLGCYVGKKLDIVFVFEVFGYCIAGNMDDEIYEGVIQNSCFGFGVCGGMYIVNMMVLVIEVLGMCLFFNFSYLVNSVEKREDCLRVGLVLLNLLEKDIKLLDIFMWEFFENVIILIIVLGGFINVVLYLIVMVKVVNVDIIIDDFQCIVDKMFYLVDFKLSGKYVMEDFYYVGGVLVVMKMLLDVGYLYGDCFIVIGKIVVENLVDLLGL